MPIFSHFSKAISVGRRNGFLLAPSSRLLKQVIHLTVIPL
ncbi:hypothetical protein BACPLE_00281 [Phocaeicola plebeius DSM 17135]|uniref:Uncharacterized protein n=1 Tax=Phocaeicola plebeius (strain DSM 17135 / JCM 12973 / CCUG 54634 / M2) TaxID=484018 RepID=B5CUB2_PHOPM|nr:hypothetical protein BACPLE_00281 [Phocaeicola plebeius DSM 17135]